MSYAVQSAAMSPTTTAVFRGQMRRVLIVLAAIGLAIALIAVQIPGAAFGKDKDAPSAESHAAKVVTFAKSHLGARFRLGKEGPRLFDCSGLVYRVYQQAGLLDKIGGGRKLAAGYYRWFKARGLVSRSNPEVGDLVWWTKRGRISHMGLYVGDGLVVSALINPYGVRMHGLRSIRVKFLAYGHVQLDG